MAHFVFYGSQSPQETCGVKCAYMDAKAAIEDYVKTTGKGIGDGGGGGVCEGGRCVSGGGCGGCVCVCVGGGVDLWGQMRLYGRQGCH